jgi:hypothetical protein
MTKTLKFKVGSSVAVIDEDIRGTISKIENGVYFLLDQTGFEYRYAAEDLVAVKGDQFEMSKYKDINNPLLLEKMRGSETKKKSFKKSSSKDEVVMEVDLHIEKLNKFHKRMDSSDILITQIDTAQQKLEYAIRNRIPNLVFIHGVGEGVLEKELKFLFGRYPVRYEPASYRKYGMGATAVYVIQNLKNQ